MPRPKPSLFICTPTSSQTCKTQFVTSLVGLVARTERRGIPTRFANFDGGHIANQRDRLAHAFLNESDATHLLFIDSDMKFPADLAIKLLQFEKPFVGTVYARRRINLETFRTASDPSLAYEFIVKYLGRSVTVTNGLCEVATIGFGFVLLAREVFAQIKERVALKTYRSPDGQKVSGFFQELEQDGEPIGEDYSFCERWREAGGNVFVYADAPLSHIGDFHFGTPFSQRLAAAQAQADNRAAPEPSAAGQDKS